MELFKAMYWQGAEQDHNASALERATVTAAENIRVHELFSPAASCS